MATQSEIWTQKYFPEKEGEIVGNPSAVKRINEFLASYRRKTSKDKAIVLVGPPGTGKTAAVYVLATKYNFDLFEINASDVRNQAKIKRIVGTAAMKKSIKGNLGTIILVDEVDGISGMQDRGGIGALIKIIKDTRNPIILTANDLSDQKFSTLKRNVQQVKFKSIQKNTISKTLKKICKQENIEHDDRVLMQISENAKGDLRAAINDLQSVAEGKSSLSIDDLENLHQIRDEEKTLFEALRVIFKEQNVRTIQKILWQVDLSTRDFGLLMQRINELIPEHMHEPEEIAAAYRALSNADIIWGRIQRKAEKSIWKLFPYFSLELSAGVSLARTKSPYHFVNYYSIFPRFFFQNLSKLRRGDMASIGAKIRNKLQIGISKAVAEYLPFLSMIYQHNPEMAKRIGAYFNFDKKEDQFIKSFWK
ncbi:MAG: replication factor C large subunit [Candidatus Helarchaeota archaeon]|nr:replication factor C large subunit [Candidatus Helarchaeota archaeon]